MSLPLLAWAAALLPHTLWLGMAACLPLAIVAQSTAPKKPQREYRAAVCGLVLLATGLAVLGWQTWPQTPVTMPVPAPTATMTAAPRATPSADGFPLPATVAPPGQTADAPTANLAADGTPVQARSTAFPQSYLVETTGVWREALALAWLIGSAAVSLLHLLAWLRLRRLGWQGTTPPASLAANFARLQSQLGVHANLVIVQGCRLAGPVVFGLWRPVILMPATLLHLPPEHLEALLAHELAHVVRRDAWWNLLSLGLETVLFFHPGVWWLTRRLAAAREQLTDQRAAHSGIRPVVLARALMHLVPNAPLHTLAADGGNLGDRIRALLGAPGPCRPAAVWPVCAGLMVALVVVSACSTRWQPVTRNPLDGIPAAAAWPALPSATEEPARDLLLAAAADPCRIVLSYASMTIDQETLIAAGLGTPGQRVVAVSELSRLGLVQPDHQVDRSRSSAGSRAEQTGAYPCDQSLSLPRLQRRSAGESLYAYIADYRMRGDSPPDPHITSIGLGSQVAAQADVDGDVAVIGELAWRHTALDTLILFEVEAGEPARRYPIEVPLVRQTGSVLAPGTRLGPDQCLILVAPAGTVGRIGDPAILRQGLPLFMQQRTDAQAESREQRQVLIVKALVDRGSTTFRVNPTHPSAAAKLATLVTLPAGERTVDAIATDLAGQTGWELVQSAPDEGQRIIPFSGCTAIAADLALHQLLRQTLLRAEVDGQRLCLMPAQADTPAGPVPGGKPSACDPAPTLLGTSPSPQPAPNGSAVRHYAVDSALSVPATDYDRACLEAGVGSPAALTIAGAWLSATATPAQHAVLEQRLLQQRPTGMPLIGLEISTIAAMRPEGAQLPDLPVCRMVGNDAATAILARPAQRPPERLSLVVPPGATWSDERFTNLLDYQTDPGTKVPPPLRTRCGLSLTVHTFSESEGKRIAIAIDGTRTWIAAWRRFSQTAQTAQEPSILPGLARTRWATSVSLPLVPDRSAAVIQLPGEPDRALMLQARLITSR